MLLSDTGATGVVRLTVAHVHVVGYTRRLEVLLMGEFLFLNEIGMLRLDEATRINRVL